MKLIHLSDGRIINPAAISVVTPMGGQKNKYIVKTLTGTELQSVPKDEFDSQLATIESSKDVKGEWNLLITRLTRAVEQLSVRIPTSIRMHM